MRGLISSFGISAFAAVVIVLIMTITPVSVAGAQLSFLTPDINAPGDVWDVALSRQTTIIDNTITKQLSSGRPIVGAVSRAEYFGATVRDTEFRPYDQIVCNDKANHVLERRVLGWRSYTQPA